MLPVCGILKKITMCIKMYPFVLPKYPDVTMELNIAANMNPCVVGSGVNKTPLSRNSWLTFDICDLSVTNEVRTALLHYTTVLHCCTLEKCTALLHYTSVLHCTVTLH